MNHQPYTILSFPSDLDTIKDYWRQLTQAYPHNFFQSYGWISCWLDTLPPETDLLCIIKLHHGQPVLGYFLGRRRQTFLGGLGFTQGHFQATGDPFYDELTAEYNAPVGDNWAQEFCAGDLHWPGCSQLTLGNIDARFHHRLTAMGNDYPRADEITGHSYFVNMQILRDQSQEYLDSLSKNKRQQIRRSIRAYEQDGPIHLTCAQNTVQARDMFRSLAELHQASWESRGRPGCFSNDYFTRFHERFIDQQFSTGQILIARVGTDTRDIGYLYGFVFNNRFLFYQSGFNYQQDNKLKPGLVAHCYLIEHLYHQGLERYDFLIGDADYKKSLANDWESMHSLTIRRSQWLHGLQNGKQQIKAGIKQVLGR